MQVVMTRAAVWAIGWLAAMTAGGALGEVTALESVAVVGSALLLAAGLFGLGEE